MINLKQVFTDKNGEVVKQNYKTEVFENGETKTKNEYRETTLMDIVRLSLLQTNIGEETPKPKESLKRYQLYRKIQGNDVIELSKKEIKYISKLISKHYDVLFAGQAIEMLNK